MSNAIKHTPSVGKVIFQVQFVRDGIARNSIDSNNTTRDSQPCTSDLAHVGADSTSFNDLKGMIRIEVSDTGCGIPAVSASLSTNVIINFHGNLFCRINCLSY